MIKRFFTVILIIIALCACSNQSPFIEPSVESSPSLSVAPSIEQLPTLSPSTSPPIIPSSSEVVHDEVIPFDALAIEAYKKVLNNDIDFFSTYLKRSISLKDYCIEECTVDDFERYFEFAVVDMDRDGILEVILYIGPPGENIVFHYEDGIVYGYSFGTRETENIRTDGSFELDGICWSICEMKFHKEFCEYTQIATIEFENDTQTPNYYINDIEVTENEFLVFYSEHSEKDMATWYEFSKENVINAFMWE